MSRRILLSSRQGSCTCAPRRNPLLIGLGLALTIAAFAAASDARGAESEAVPRTMECAPTAGGATPALEENSRKVEAIHVSATGYGAPPPKYYPENQRRLMSMRAAKIDAYRALAETVNGLHIWGGTTIGDMVVQKDKYRVFLDGFVRGARIVSVTANEDGNYETVVDLRVDDRFLNKILTEPTSMPCVKDGAQITFAPLETPSTFYYSE